MQTPFDRLLDQFVADVTQTAQTVALESLRQALQVGAASNGTSPKRALTPLNDKSSSTRASSPRRPRVDRDDLPTQIVSSLRSTPGQTIGELAAALGLSTADVKPSIKKLIASKLIRFVGQTRARKYFVAGRRGAAASIRPTAARAHRRAKPASRPKAGRRRNTKAARGTRKRRRGKR